MSRPEDAKPTTSKECLLLGAWLRQLRQQRNLPLRSVAAGAEMDSTHLSKIELGQRLPTEAQTAALAKFFGVQVEEMEAKRIAARFLHDFGQHPAASRAIMILREQAGEYTGDPQEQSESKNALDQ